jgi:hypothetical protein
MTSADSSKRSGVRLRPATPEQSASETSVLETVAQLYFAAFNGAAPHDPGDADEQKTLAALDGLTDVQQRIALQAVGMRSIGLRCVISKLAIAIAESDTGAATCATADLTTKLLGSSLDDLLALAAADDLRERYVSAKLI